LAIWKKTCTIVLVCYGDAPQLSNCYIRIAM